MAIATLIPITGTAGACQATGQPRASWYRAHRQSPPVLGLDDVPAAAPAGGERRPSPARHPPRRVKPELLATAPNRMWSWDITKLAGPAKWTW
jgi:hypothetical protein